LTPNLGQTTLAETGNLAPLPPMIAPRIPPISASVQARDQELAREFQKIEKHDWWTRGYSILVAILLSFAAIVSSLPAVRHGAENIFKINMVDVVFGLIALVVFFNIYAISQAILIKRLRRQLAEKQGHSDLLRNLAMVDPLTGLYNRRFAEHRLAAEVARSERKGHPLTILTLDLNNFKYINDTYGHPAGDLVLQEFAVHLNNAIRGGDLAVRLGGDEFLVLLPECTLQQLGLVLGRLGSLAVDWHAHKIPVTFSAGWKQYELGERPEEMLARADEVLYARKRAGKKTQTLVDINHEESEQTAQTDTEPASLHVLVDLTCPHCHKQNSVAVDTHSGTNTASAREAHCAHCKRAWQPVLSGPIMAGPFPK
jgi:diguanylate cyclase (GGDEF)-like protein